MKTLKTIIASAVLLFSATTMLNAQGIQLGYINEATTSKIGSVSTTENVNGIQGGVTYEMSIQEPISLHYGLLYSYLFDNTDLPKYTAHNLEIPFHIVATFPLSGNVSAFLFGGPNFSYALSAKTKVGELEIDLYDDEDMSKFNLQAGVGGGLKFGNLSLKAGYDWGLFDLHSSETLSIKTNKFHVGLGYNF